MPILLTPEDKWTMARPVNAVQSTFTIDQEADGFWKSAAKVVARIPTNTALGLLATVETIFKATLTALSALLYPITDAPFKNLKDSTALAGRATIEAFKGVFGYSTKIEVETAKKRSKHLEPHQLQPHKKVHLLKVGKKSPWRTKGCSPSSSSEQPHSAQQPISAKISLAPSQKRTIAGHFF